MWGGIFVIPLLFGFVLSKVCTNGGVSSHTVRYELLRNSSWEGGNLAHLDVIHGDDRPWWDLIPRKMLREGDGVGWGVRRIGGCFLKEVSLHDVRLDPNSVHGVAQQTNLEYLLMLDVDRLVWSFRKMAGLETPGEPYGGWEAPDCELRGHFVGWFTLLYALFLIN